MRAEDFKMVDPQAVSEAREQGLIDIRKMNKQQAEAAARLASTVGQDAIALSEGEVELVDEADTDPTDDLELANGSNASDKLWSAL